MKCMLSITGSFSPNVGFSQFLQLHIIQNVQVSDTTGDDQRQEDDSK